MEANEYSAAMGRRLAGARDMKGLTQAQVAKRTGVAKSTVAAWEKGYRDVRAWRLSGVAQALGVTVDYLLDTDSSGELRSLTDEVDRLRDELRAYRNPVCDAPSQHAAVKCNRSLAHHGRHQNGELTWD